MTISKLPTVKAIEEIEKKLKRRAKAVKYKDLKEFAVIVAGVLIADLMHDLIIYLIGKLF